MYLITEGKQRTPVSDYATASKAFRHWIESNGLGGSDLKRRDGDLLDELGKVVAHVSYNGRIWTADRQTLVQEAAR